jgi:hypothetical protein
LINATDPLARATHTASEVAAAEAIVADGGSILIPGDNNVFAQYLGEVDNGDFAVNLFDWLRGCGASTPVAVTTWGGIKASYK